MATFDCAMVNVVSPFRVTEQTRKLVPPRSTARYTPYITELETPIIEADRALSRGHSGWGGSHLLRSVGDFRNIGRNHSHSFSVIGQTNVYPVSKPLSISNQKFSPINRRYSLTPSLTCCGVYSNSAAIALALSTKVIFDPISFIFSMVT